MYLRMMRAWLIRHAAALLLCLGVATRVAGAPLSPASRVGPTGMGPVVVGTTPAQAKATGTRLTATTPAPGSTCYYLMPPDLPGIAFMVEAGTIRRVEVRSGPFRTVDGFRIGDRLERLTSLYGKRAMIAPDKYDPGVRVVTVTPAGEAGLRYRIVYEIKHGVVRRIVAGALPQVTYVEGCL
jgi:hypothetical protein